MHSTNPLVRRGFPGSFGLLLVVGLPAVLVFFFKQDERIVDLACCSVVLKSYYDPGKVQL